MYYPQVIRFIDLRVFKNKAYDFFDVRLDLIICIPKMVTVNFIVLKIDLYFKLY